MSLQRFITYTVIITLGFALPASAATKTIQPGPSPVGMDVWLGNNVGAVSSGWVWVGGSSLNDLRNTYLKFNLGGLPLSANKVTLSLFSGSLTGFTSTGINWFLPTSQWHKNALTWTSQPTSVSAGTTPAPAYGAWVNYDITGIYNLWRANPTYKNYGLRLTPVSYSNNYAVFVGSSNTAYPTFRPKLTIDYASQSTDSIPKHKWPFSSAYSSRTISGYRFGDTWQVPGTTCTDGTYKKHTGVDYGSGAGNPVYAVEDGYMKEHITQSPWASNLVIEHTSPTGGKYTTVYWHITPVQDVINNWNGGFVPRGMQIGTVANISGAHLHFGSRQGSYTANVSGVGALPATSASCGGYPVFAGGFMDPELQTNMLFQ